MQRLHAFLIAALCLSACTPAKVEQHTPAKPAPTVKHDDPKGFGSVFAPTNFSAATVSQGSAAVIGAPWPVQLSNGSAALIGQQTKSGSLPVTLASDQGVISTSDAATGSTGAAVPSKAIMCGGTQSGTLRALAVDASGNLGVNIISGAGSGGTALADGATFTPGTTSVTPVDAELDDVSPGTLTEGKAGALRANAQRSLYVTLRDSAGNERGLNISAAGNISIDSIASSIVAGTGATHLGKAEDAAHGDGDTGVAVWTVRKDTPATTAGSNGDYAAFTTDSRGRQWTRTTPDSGADPSYWSGITSASTQTSTSLDASEWRTVCFWVTVSNSGSPVGSISLLASVDNTNFAAQYLEANKVTGANFTNASAFPGGTTIGVSSPAGTAAMQFCVEPALPHLKITWTSVSGGTTGAINAGYFYRVN